MIISFNNPTHCCTLYYSMHSIQNYNKTQYTALNIYDVEYIICHAFLVNKISSQFTVYYKIHYVIFFKIDKGIRKFSSNLF